MRIILLTTICMVLAATGQVQAAPAISPALLTRVQASSGIKDARHVLAVIEAAQAAETPTIRLELLLAMSDIESDFMPNATSRLVGTVRQTGVWNSSTKPKGSNGTYFCGVTQATAPTWARCLELRELREAYKTTVHELELWLKPAHGDLTKALQGYGCGNAGIKGACKAYAGKVLRRMRYFQGPLPIV